MATIIEQVEALRRRLGGQDEALIETLWTLEGHKIDDLLKMPDAVAADYLRAAHKAIDELDAAGTVAAAENSGDDMLCVDEGCPQHGTDHTCETRVETDEEWMERVTYGEGV